MKILLVEPRYSNKYPPLGLMKISAYHKALGHKVTFAKGTYRELRDQKWDRIYITTLFTFYFERTIKTIKYYSKSLREDSGILFIGGIASTIIPNEFENELNRLGVKNYKIINGLLNRPNMLGSEFEPIDYITPDYSIIINDEELNPYLKYSYKVQNSYIAYTTRGCINKCSFCAVPNLEPNFITKISIENQIKEIDKQLGKNLRNLMLMDNNVLASPRLGEIVNELITLGYERGNKNYISDKNQRLRKFIDFNQGVDARVIIKNPERLTLLSRLEVKPLRIAFDDIKDSENYYKPAMRLAAELGFNSLSNYMLFNYNDRPEDLYNRILVNIELNEEFENKGYKSSIWSFPMKYSPLRREMCVDGKDDHFKNRKWRGVNWSLKQLRGIQCILNATHGVVGPKRSYFELAFGNNVEEYLLLLQMPENMIINRVRNIENGMNQRWKNIINGYSNDQREYFFGLIAENKFSMDIFRNLSDDYKQLYEMYL